GPATEAANPLPAGAATQEEDQGQPEVVRPRDAGPDGDRRRADRVELHARHLGEQHGPARRSRADRGGGLRRHLLALTRTDGPTRPRSRPVRKPVDNPVDERSGTVWITGLRDLSPPTRGAPPASSPRSASGSAVPPTSRPCTRSHTRRRPDTRPARPRPRA